MTRARAGLVALTMVLMAGCGSVAGVSLPGSTLPAPPTVEVPTGSPATEAPPTAAPRTDPRTELVYVKVAGAPIGNPTVDDGRDGEHCVGIHLLVDLPDGLALTDLQVSLEDAGPFAETGSACGGHATCEGGFRWSAANAQEPCWFPVREVGTSDFTTDRVSVRVNGSASCTAARKVDCDAFAAGADRKLDIDITLTAPSVSPTAGPPSSVPGDPPPTN